MLYSVLDGMATQITLIEQAEVISSTVRCKYRVFTPLQLAQLEAAEQTVRDLQKLRDRLATVQKDDAEKVTDEMADELIDLLQLQRT